MSLLSGFDLVYAVTQHTINQQIQLLSVMSVLPTKWTYQSTDGVSSIDADLGFPKVDMNTGDSSSRKVRILFPLVAGTFSYATIGKDKSGKFVVVPKTADVTGWQLILTVNLSLTEIAANLISEHKSIPAAVKAQLSAFTEDMYDINHLFLNFEDADLVDNYELITANNTDLNEPNVIDQLRDIVKSLLKNLKGNDNPFIFGYTINDKKPLSSNADFVPTGTTYSVYPEPTKLDRSTINFLSVTQKRDVPGAGHGIFTHNWVNTDDVQGAFVIAQDLIMSKLLPPLAKIMQASPSDFQPSGASLTLTKPNNIGGNITCTITPNGGTNKIAADFYSNFRVDVYDKAGSNIGYVDGYLKWTTTISFAFDNNNNLAVSVSNSPLEKQSQDNPNTLGKIEKVLAIFADAVLKAFSSGLAPNVFENLSADDWAKININADLSVISSDMKTRLVLPAGSKFFFKDAILSPEGHLIMTTTIKN